MSPDFALVAHICFKAQQFKASCYRKSIGQESYAVVPAPLLG